MHAWVQPDGSWWVNNAGAVTGGNSVLVVDTCATADRTRRFLAAVWAATHIELTVPVVHQIQAGWASHLGRARSRQLRDIHESLREITDPFASPDTSAAPR